MYSVSDKTEAIKALQRMIGANESGRLDSSTKKKIYDLVGVSAVERVDYSLFLHIKAALRRQRITDYVARHLRMDKQRLIAGSFSRGEMRRINLMLGEAIERNRIEAYPPRGSYFTTESDIAVQELRRFFNISEGGLDEELIYLLIKNLDAHSFIDNISTS